MNNEEYKLLYVDLFAGAGGTSFGIESAFQDGERPAKVIACVNHDRLAIDSHAENIKHCKHYNEDINNVDVKDLAAYVGKWRRKYPNALLVLWASLECTQHSRAKGGKPKDEGSMTLAWSLYRYVEALNPDLVQIENVTEFKDWGPLNDEGHPIKERKGEMFKDWCATMDSYGYRNEWVAMNAADYGARTSRNRLFGMFAKEGLPIVFPKPTHAKYPEKFKGLRKKWLAVRPLLDLENMGDSIFAERVRADGTRIPRIKSDKTFERVYNGLVKHIAKGDTAFLTKYFSGNTPDKNISIENPSGAITCVDHHALVQAQFLDVIYGAGYTSSIEAPSPTVTTKDRMSLVTMQPEPFITLDYSSGKTWQTIDEPSGTILTTPKQNIVNYIFLPQWGDNCTHSIDKPSPTLLASMHKTGFSLLTIVGGKYAIKVTDFDTEIRVRIKMFMAAYGIADIRLRMLTVMELKRIQGFPENYILLGSQTDQKRFIGNAVHKLVPMRWVRTLINHL